MSSATARLSMPVPRLGSTGILGLQLHPRGPERHVKWVGKGGPSPRAPRRERPRSGRVAGLLQPIEDQVESELELVAVVVARLEDVLGGELGEMGGLVDR